MRPADDNTGTNFAKTGHSVASTMLLLATGLVLVSSQGVMAYLSPGWSQPSFKTLSDVLPLVTLLGGPALLGLAAATALARQRVSTVSVLGIVAVGLAMRAVWYGVPVLIDDDYFRYLWDGAMVVAGENPYATSPKAFLDGAPLPAGLGALADRAPGVLAGINFPELTTIYPGTAQIGFTLASLVAPLKLDGLRAVYLLGDAAAASLIWFLLSATGRSPLLAALYWANPLVVWSSHGTVHTESLMAPLVLGACLATWRGRSLAGAALLAFAVGVKLWPVLLVPVLARLTHARGGSVLKAAAMFCLVSAFLLAPLIVSALAGQKSGLVAYSEHWWINNGPFSWISWWIYEATSGSVAMQRVLRAVIAFAVGGFALWLARRPAQTLEGLLGAALAIAAVTFYAAPAQFPWYALWFLPLAAAVDCRPLLLASATLAFYYLFQPLANQGLGFRHLYGWSFVHALPVWGWLALAVLRERHARPLP